VSTPGLKQGEPIRIATKSTPFASTGILKKFVVILEPEQLTPEGRLALRDAESQAVMAVH
jgi:hypothetical protein